MILLLDDKFPNINELKETTYPKIHSPFSATLPDVNSVSENGTASRLRDRPAVTDIYFSHNYEVSVERNALTN